MGQPDSPKPPRSLRCVCKQCLALGPSTTTPDLPLGSRVQRYSWLALVAPLLPGPFPADPGSARLAELPLGTGTRVLPSSEKTGSQGQTMAHLCCSCCCERPEVAQDMPAHGAHLRDYVGVPTGRGQSTHSGSQGRVEADTPAEGASPAVKEGSPQVPSNRGITGRPRVTGPTPAARHPRKGPVPPGEAPPSQASLAEEEADSEARGTAPFQPHQAGEPFASNKVLDKSTIFKTDGSHAWPHVPTTETAEL